MTNTIGTSNIVGKGDPPDPLNDDHTHDAASASTNELLHTNSDSFSLDIDGDIPSHDHNDKFLMDAPMDTTDTLKIDLDNDNPSLFAATLASIRPSSTNTNSSNNADAPKTHETITFYDTENDDNLNPIGTNHLQYTTTSEWDNSPWSQVPYKNKHQSNVIDPTDKRTSTTTAPGY